MMKGTRLLHLTSLVLVALFQLSRTFIFPFRNLATKGINGINSRSYYINKYNFQSSIKMSTQEEIDAENEVIMNGWLEDIIYSGDSIGYLKRRASEMLCREFLDFLTKKANETTDSDEKDAISEVLNIVKSSMDLTDGMGQLSGLAYESRLDQILFTPPNKRKVYLNEISNDLTPAFIDYIQKELKLSNDQDSKVVLASILKMVGEVKGIDAMAGSAILLAQADETLGDEFKKVNEEKAELEKLLSVNNRNDQILAGLMFSTNDIVEDILNNLHEIDDRFVSWLGKKVETTSDIEERVALNSLLDTINSILEKVNEVNEDNAENLNEELTMEQVKLRMQEVQMGTGLNKNEVGKAATSFVVQEDSMSTFMKIITIFRETLADGATLSDAVLRHYDLCDYKFMETLKLESENSNNQGADASFYSDLLSEISKAMALKIGTAQQRLEHILSKKRPPAMESEIVLMARKGEVDEALILLLEANIQQAQAAGATQAAEVLANLVKRANAEREKKLPDEQRLLRALLRLKVSEERKGLLYAAFKPVKTMTEESQFVEGPPLITPPAFIAVVRNFILGFGNVDSFDIMDKAREIIEEAQIVATELYGESMSPRQQQEYMFKKKTVSIWDLASLEEKALTSGEEVPWEGNSKYDTMDPEDVLNEVKTRKIGGSEDITHKY